MFIEIRELELHPVEFEEELAPGAIDLGEDVRQRGALKSSGRADLVEEHHGKRQLIKDIRLQGKFSTSVEMPCARCSEPIVHDLAGMFDMMYRPQAPNAGTLEQYV